MKTVDVSELFLDVATLLSTVEGGEDIVIARGGTPVARLSKVESAERLAGPRFDRTPGLLRSLPGWENWTFDPSIFAPLMTDDDLRAEGFDV